MQNGPLDSRAALNCNRLCQSQWCPNIINHQNTMVGQQGGGWIYISPNKQKRSDIFWVLFGTLVTITGAALVLIFLGYMRWFQTEFKVHELKNTRCRTLKFFLGLQIISIHYLAVSFGPFCCFLCGCSRTQIQINGSDRLFCLYNALTWQRGGCFSALLRSIFSSARYCTSLCLQSECFSMLRLSSSPPRLPGAWASFSKIFKSAPVSQSSSGSCALLVALARNAAEALTCLFPPEWRLNSWHR